MSVFGEEKIKKSKSNKMKGRSLSRGGWEGVGMCSGEESSKLLLKR